MKFKKGQKVEVIHDGYDNVKDGTIVTVGEVGTGSDSFWDKDRQFFFSDFYDKLKIITNSQPTMTNIKWIVKHGDLSDLMGFVTKTKAERHIETLLEDGTLEDGADIQLLHVTETFDVKRKGGYKLIKQK